MVVLIQKVSGLALVLGVGGLVASCAKKDAPPETPGFRLFTNQAEIMDATVKANFRKRSADRFPDVLVFDPSEKVIFINSDTVKIGPVGPRYSVIKKGNQYLFYSPQAELIYKRDELVWNMQKYAAPRVPIIGSPYYLGTTQKVLVGYEEGKQMRFPYFQYYLIKPNATPFNRTSGFLFNELNENVISEITGVDTLAVQTGSATTPIQ
ncbi:hypothetical protein [Hymenobacter cheonanensis]|uniref:hypothetical protein n=1 Tax=Hymenobacter sp. CA2-7 TaxID=3063993 RepID=UPI0027130913|nr:hypothetical protein [Hymenobacter sp. CA2-7]MDO7886027.1 hypothetical protein [Hymenobacter sp. CA2-7]